LEPLVTGLVVPLGPLMQGLLETQGLTVTGHLEDGLVKVTPQRGSKSVYEVHVSRYVETSSKYSEQKCASYFIE
jgi:hypothetical protein